MFGVMRAGGIAALSSPAYTVDEMMHCLRTVKCRYIITAKESLGVVRAAATKLRIADTRIFVLGGSEEGFQSVRELVSLGKQCGENGQVDSFRLPIGKANNMVCAVLCFSSGTTGLPKAVGVRERKSQYCF
jgi:4-coumarate--CoA ligase